MPYPKKIIIILLFIFIGGKNFNLYAQTVEERYYSFKKQANESFTSFREECNHKYIDFLKNAWAWYNGEAPLPIPKEETPIPPKPYDGKGNDNPIDVSPIEIKTVSSDPQPKPVEPIREVPTPNEKYFTFSFYGQECKVRLPEYANLKLEENITTALADGWQQLCTKEMNNAIRDCLETRIRYNLCDWAYLLFLNQLGKQFCEDVNCATLLTAFLYCQSGYQMRLGIDNNNLILLYGSKHQIYNKSYYSISGTNFYPFTEASKSIKICDASFDGETPLSLIIDKEQLLGSDMSSERSISSQRYSNIKIGSQVPENLIKFYNEYPTSAIDGNPMTRWAMYANTPLSEKTKGCFYSSLNKEIGDLTKLEAAERLLNLVQTGLVYEYDDKVWGHDRAFFSEETLYYPYADCEDRSILLSRLVRDLLGLDVALIYYPGHLATAVCFNEDVPGDAMIINGRKFIVCDPTYIGAPVGKQMPDLQYDKAQAIILNR